VTPTAPREVSTPHVVQVVQEIDRGGLEMLAVDLAIALKARGVGASVVGLSGGGRLQARLQDAGVPFHLVGGAHYLSPRSHWAVRRLLRGLRPAVVHSHHLPALLNAGPSARFSCGARGLARDADYDVEVCIFFNLDKLLSFS
jgi:hypothetical protein